MEEDLAKIWEVYKDVYYAFGHLVYRTDQGKPIPEEVDELMGILRRDYLGGVT
jgi:hypothetical protein